MENKEVKEYLRKVLDHFENTYEEPEVELIPEDQPEPEKEFEDVQVELYLRKKICPQCNSDYMIRSSDGMALMSNPPRYGHTCGTCGFVDTYVKVYPELIYKEIGLEE